MYSFLPCIVRHTELDIHTLNSTCDSKLNGRKNSKAKLYYSLERRLLYTSSYIFCVYFILPLLRIQLFFSLFGHFCIATMLFHVSFIANTWAATLAAIEKLRTILIVAVAIFTSSFDCKIPWKVSKLFEGGTFLIALDIVTLLLFLLCHLHTSTNHFV